MLGGLGSSRPWQLSLHYWSDELCRVLRDTPTARLAMRTLHLYNTKTEHDDLILAKALQRREEVRPSGKKRKVAQKMERKCLMLSHYEKLNDQCKPRTLRLPCPCIHQMI